VAPRPRIRSCAGWRGRSSASRSATPFDRLVAANRQDQSVTRYATFQDLLAYCDPSANPVGELVLYLCRAAAPTASRCPTQRAALQLVEFWQTWARTRPRLPAR
jgi:phytoene/squalene synthetase